MIAWLSIEQSVEALKQDHIIACPTEAIYGLSGQCSQKAITALRDLKTRESSQGILLLVHDIALCESWLDLPQDFDPKDLQSDRPTTWIMPASDEAPDFLLGPDHTLALRISDHPVVQAITTMLHAPILSTSANLRGEKPATTPQHVMQVFADSITGITVGYLGAHSRPSMIKKLDGTILRA